MSLTIRNVVFACPGNTPESYDLGARPVANFYAELLGMEILHEDWFIVGGEASALRLGFGDGPIDYQPPGWPDGAQQMHLDIAVPLFVAPPGARLLRDSGEWQVYADPIGHPFCLYEQPVDGARVVRIVIDCPDPPALAAFYSALLDRPERELDTPSRVVLAGAPGLAFQRSDSPAPRWPDPAYPQQVHLDLLTTDVPAARAHAMDVGAQPLQTTGTYHHVFADPAGHPFCI
ncbi:VOC family protein [Kribbella sp. NPDC051586]|uniref:VOC family protein n=1 Tax=Kribbella sp. NPDC051586 TaxID=3364118 RepID=UPI0037AF8F0A